MKRISGKPAQVSGSRRRIANLCLAIVLVILAGGLYLRWRRPTLISVVRSSVHAFFEGDLSSMYYDSPKWERDLTPLTDRQLKTISDIWLKPKLKNLASYEIRSLDVDKLAGIGSALVRVRSKDGRVEEFTFDSVLTDEGPKYRIRDAVILGWTIEAFLNNPNYKGSTSMAKAWLEGVTKDRSLLQSYGVNGLVSQQLPARLVNWDFLERSAKKIVSIANAKKSK